MTIDWTIRISDVLLGLGILGGGWRYGLAFRDEIRGLRQTVYGSEEPPLIGLVKRVERLEEKG